LVITGDGGAVGPEKTTGCHTVGEKTSTRPKLKWGAKKCGQGRRTIEKYRGGLIPC